MISLVNGLSRVILKVTSRNRRAPDPLPEWAYMIVYDLNSGHREYPGYDEIEDRRGGGRGRSRRSDGTYMGYGGGIYDHYGMHEKMKEMEERENELEERERRLEERERRHEMEDREYRRMGYESYPIDYYGDDRYYGDGPQMRRGRGRGRGRSY
mgnify:CR=1 FL=1